jgi:hypothetical protein
LAIVFLLCVVTIFWSGGAQPKFMRVPPLDFIWLHRWWVLGGAGVVAMVVHVIIQRRQACPACGMRGFTRVVWHGGDSDAANDPWYGVRHCRSCGIRQVECERGVERLPPERWEEAADRYARLQPAVRDEA